MHVYVVLLVCLYSHLGGGLECVSGWRLIDIPPFWAPKMGQELKKVDAIFCECVLLKCELPCSCMQYSECCMTLFIDPTETKRAVFLSWKIHC